MISARAVPADLNFSVAICTLNRRAYLERAVSAVLNQLRDFPNGRLIVIDNGSTDSTPEYLASVKAANRQFDAAAEPRQGLYYARARAIGNAAGEFLIFLDDDAVPKPGWLNGILETLLSAPDVGVVGCSIEPIWEGERPEWLSDRLAREIPIYQVESPDSPGRFPSFPAGISLGIRVNECARLYIGPERRTEYPLGRKGTPADGRAYQMVGGEDNDLCEIYARNGYRVLFTNRACVGHAVSPERLKPEWYLRKYRSEGHLRIRLSRLTGRPPVNNDSIKMLAGLPVFALLRPVHRLFRPASALLFEAYYAKCLGAWKELLAGERPGALPYDARSLKGRAPGPAASSGDRGEATT